MKVKIIHKANKKYINLDRTFCGVNTNNSSYIWKNVNCKKCLKHHPRYYKTDIWVYLRSLKNK